MNAEEITSQFLALERIRGIFLKNKIIFIEIDNAFQWICSDTDSILVLLHVEVEG